MRKKRKTNKIIASVFIVLFVFVSVGGYVFADDKTEIKNQGGWKETYIDKAEQYKWCGNNQLLLGGGGKNYRIIDIQTQKVQQLPSEIEKYYAHIFCSSDGRYVFLRKIGNKEDREAFVVYDTKTTKIQFMPNMTECDLFGMVLQPSLISPDGRYLMWCKNGEIKLFGENILKLTPFFQNTISKPSFRHVEWSPDSKKLYILTESKPQSLIIYNILNNKNTSFKIKFGGGFYGHYFKVSPDGNKIYIWACKGEGEDYNLYILDLAKYDSNVSVINLPIFIKGVDTFDISIDGAIIYNMTSDNEMTSSIYSIEYAGLYFTGIENVATQKLTASNDGGGCFSKDGRAFAFIRTSEKPVSSSVYILLKQ